MARVATKNAAERLFKEFIEKPDIVRFSKDLSDLSSWFGWRSATNRYVFLEELSKLFKENHVKVYTSHTIDDTN